MKTYLIVALLVGVLFQAVPKQANKPQPDQNDGKQFATQPQQPVTVGTENITLSGPSSQEKEDGANGKPKQATWCEKVFEPVRANWPLIGVAIWGILVARSTLHAIRWQAEETAKATQAMRDSIPLQTKAANAAFLNAQYLINTERPWLLIEIKPLKEFGTAFTISFRNRGRTPAEVVSFCQQLEPGTTKDDLGLPEAPEYYDEARAMKHTRIVPPGQRWRDPGDDSLTVDQNFIPEQWKDIQGSRIRAVYWGRLRYRDLIEQPRTIHELEKPGEAIIHETCFCYWWSPRIQDFIIGGPKGYNKHT